jgi:hypothetical protein
LTRISDQVPCRFLVDTVRTFPLKSIDVGIYIYGPDAVTGNQEVILTGAAVDLPYGLVKDAVAKDAVARDVVFQVFNGDWRKKRVIYGPGNAK